MNILLASLCGIIVTVMNVFNGELSTVYGTYIATCLIHAIGLLIFIIIMKLKKQPIIWNNQIPWYLYTGGIVGVLTVVFSVVSVGTIGASLLTSLGLLGQMLTSVLLEHKGWFGSIQKSLSPMKCLSFVVVLIGIGVMVG